MTVRYVGPGGLDTNSGLTWALRKLTLNGVEDTPVVAGDIVYVGPGTYREWLTVDVAGTAGNPITYIGDRLGIYTDGIGGMVRITGSDNDQTAVRTTAIAATTQSYRTFVGFTIDTTSNYPVSVSGAATNWIMDGIHLLAGTGGGKSMSFSAVPATANHTFRKCFFQNAFGIALEMSAAAVVDAGILVENCIFVCNNPVNPIRVGGWTVRNCTFYQSTANFIRIQTYSLVAAPVNVYGCLMLTCNGTAFAGVAVGDIVEDYNTLWQCAIDRANTTAGTNSNNRPFILDMPYLGGMDFPMVKLKDVSQMTGCGTSVATEDFFGITRPTTNSKVTRGAIQHQPVERSTTQVYNTSVASLKLTDAGVTQFRVPTTNVSTTISVRVWREADYAGTLPRMVIKQPGQTDTTVTDTAAAGQWNELTTTLTPAAVPGYVVVELQSLNTATSGSYGVYFDALVVN